MTLELLSPRFCVCKPSESAALPLDRPFVFVSRTDRELSLVCPEGLVPEGCLVREDGWRAMRVTGVLDFALIGILAGLTALLAANRVGVFVVSTYDTDYILVRETDLSDAVAALEKGGHTFLAL